MLCKNITDTCLTNQSKTISLNCNKRASGLKMQKCKNALEAYSQKLLTHIQRRVACQLLNTETSVTHLNGWK